MTTEHEKAIRLLAIKCNVPHRFVQFIGNMGEEEMLEEKINFLKNAIRCAGLGLSFISDVKAESLCIIYEVPIYVVKIVLVTEKQYASSLSRENRLILLAKVLKKTMSIVDHILP